MCGEPASRATSFHFRDMEPGAAIDGRATCQLIVKRVRPSRPRVGLIGQEKRSFVSLLYTKTYSSLPSSVLSSPVGFLRYKRKPKPDEGCCHNSPAGGTRGPDSRTIIVEEMLFDWESSPNLKRLLLEKKRALKYKRVGYLICLINCRPMQNGFPHLVWLERLAAS